MKTKELLDALTVVKPGLSNKEIIEQANAFAFMDGKVVTYNDQISVSHPVEGLDIDGAIKAEELYQFLSKVKSEEIDISIEEEKVLMKAGRSKASFLMEAEIKLDLSALHGKKKWKKIPDEFIPAIQFVSMATSNNASTPALTCVHVREDGKVEATDQYRASRTYGGLELDFLFPSEFVAVVARLKPTKICLESSWVFFKTEAGTVLSCRIFQAEYPNIDPLLSRWDNGQQTLHFPETIKEVVERAMVFSKREHIFDEVIHISIGKKKMEISSQSDYGEFSESIPMEYKGEPIEFKIRPHLFLDIIKEKDASVQIDDRFIYFASNEWQYITILVV